MPRPGKFIMIVLSLAAAVALAAVPVFYIFIQPRKTLLPVLLYHSISSDGSNDNIPAVSRELFLRQMEYLSRKGYKTVYPSEVKREYSKNKRLPEKWVILTFDDGYRDFLENAYPVLKKYNFQAVLFVSPDRLGKSGIYLAWEEVIRISREGLVRIGSHSLNHGILTCLSAEEAERRIRVSKQLLERGLHQPVTAFAYPYGAFNYDLRRIVESAGYFTATGTTYPLGKFRMRDFYNMRRVFVSSISRYPGVFRFMLSGYYVPVRGALLRVFNIDAPRDANECVDIIGES